MSKSTARVISSQTTGDFNQLWLFPEITTGDSLPGTAPPVLNTPPKEDSQPPAPDRPGCHGGGRLLSGNPGTARKDRAGLGRTPTGEEFTADERTFDALCEGGMSIHEAKGVTKKALLRWAERQTKATAEREVLQYLVKRAGFAPKEGRWLMCFPSQETISEATDIPLRTVRYAVRKLRERGIIGTSPRYGAPGTPRAGRRIGTVYTLYAGQVFTEAPTPVKIRNPKNLPVAQNPNSERVAGQERDIEPKKNIYIDSDEKHKNKSSVKSKKHTYRDSLEDSKPSTTKSASNASTKPATYRFTSTIDWRRLTSIPTGTGLKQERRAQKFLNGRELTYQERRDRDELLEMLDQWGCFHGETLYRALTSPTPILDYIYTLKGSWKAGPGAYGIKLRKLIMAFDTDHTAPPVWNNPEPAQPPPPSHRPAPPTVVLTPPRFTEEQLRELARKVHEGEISLYALPPNTRNEVSPYVLQLKTPQEEESKAARRARFRKRTNT